MPEEGDGLQPPVKRKRGRPPGTKNKPKVGNESVTSSPAAGGAATPHPAASPSSATPDASAAASPAPKRRGRPPGVKNRPKADVRDDAPAVTRSSSVASLSNAGSQQFEDRSSLAAQGQGGPSRSSAAMVSADTNTTAARSSSPPTGKRRGRPPKIKQNAATRPQPTAATSSSAAGSEDVEMGEASQGSIAGPSQVRRIDESDAPTQAKSGRGRPPKNKGQARASGLVEQDDRQDASDPDQMLAQPSAAEQRNTSSAETLLAPIPAMQQSPSPEATTSAAAEADSNSAASSRQRTGQGGALQRSGARRDNGNVSGKSREWTHSGHDRLVPPSAKDIAKTLAHYLLTNGMVYEGQREYPNSDPEIEANILDGFQELLDREKSFWGVGSDEARLRYDSAKLPSHSASLYPDVVEEPPPAANESQDAAQSAAFREALAHTGKTLEISTLCKDKSHSIKLPRGKSIALSQFTKDLGKPGILLNTGGHVYSLDWAPKADADRAADDYLAIAVSVDASPRSLYNAQGEGASPGVIQIWSTDLLGTAALSYLCASSASRVSSLRWAPISRKAESSMPDDLIGILAVAYQSGSVDIFAVPKADALDASCRAKLPHISLKPLLSLDAGQDAPNCLAWYGLDQIAVGHADGYLSVWSLSDALSMPPGSSPRPTHMVRIGRSPLSDICFDTYGDYIFTAGFDGAIVATSLDEPEIGSQLSYQRGVCYAVAYSHHLVAPLLERFDDLEVKYVELAENGKVNTKSVQGHHGRVRAIDSTRQHPFVASGSADGVVQVVNAPLRVSSRINVDSYALYRLEANRSTGELRFIENIVPASLQQQNKSSKNKGNSAKTKAGSGNKPAITHGWHPAISITALRWNRNAGSQEWIASGTASGAVRIDYAGYPPTKAFVVDDIGE